LQIGVADQSLEWGTQKEGHEKRSSRLFAGHRTKRFTERKKGRQRNVREGEKIVKKCKRKMRITGKEIRGKGRKRRL
jgi:hypothetical protein